ncbi:hypothetical protein PUN28_010683 [Cardiocondyla obscurior]|uniref:Uncharacterized protein n=1 Tax=Cardiocondyla obscurior TaxID=286306 RepID=A0AAW2FMX3_9HYME
MARHVPSERRSRPRIGILHRRRDTDRDSLDLAALCVPPRRPSRASSPGNRLLKSVGIAGRFLGRMIAITRGNTPRNCSEHDSVERHRRNNVLIS